VNRERHRRLAMGVAAVRIAVGALLAIAPRALDRGQPRPATASALLFTRTVGIRDLVLGLGTAAAAGSSQDADLRRWVLAGTLSDTLDVVAALAATRALGRRALVSALIPVPVILADLVVLAAHDRADGTPPGATTPSEPGVPAL
jgi:hypothetical protein